MKYGGNITILDDQGEIVFERELSADEMIAELLRRDQVLEDTPLEAATAENPLPRHTTPPGGFTQSGYRGELTCAHGVGHGPHTHGCDGCCIDLVTEGGKLVDKRVAETPRGGGTPKGKAPRACSLCGKEGHTRRTCGDPEVEQEPEQEPTPPAKKRGRPPKAKPQESELPPPVDEPLGQPLNESEYDIVKDARENDFKFVPQKYADELDVDIREINRAILTKTFEDYERSYRARA